MLGASAVGGNLTVTDSVGNLTQTGALTVTGTSSFTTSAANATITLTNTGNLLTGAASLNTNGATGSASLTNNLATVLGASNVGGNLVVVDRVGNLTQTGVLTVGGTSSFTTSAANATITLNSANLLTGAVALNTNGANSDASLTNAKATALAASTVGGNLTVTDTVGNPDADRRADRYRRVVVRDLGKQRDDHTDQRQPADRRGGPHHQWDSCQCQPDQRQGDGAG